MKEFASLLEVATVLNSPEGCPWDLEQTFASLRPYVLEEAHEVLEAVDTDDDQQMIEELGDLFYTVIFYAKVAERENRFSIKEILEQLRAKLIRRHPHVFGEEKAKSMEEVIQKWERVKDGENASKGRKSALDGIPITLPSLQKAQKLMGRIKKHGERFETRAPVDREEELAEKLLGMVELANEEGIDLECALQKVLRKKEADFRLSELQ